MAEHRHKRETDSRRLPKASLVAGPIALVATLSTVGMGVLAASPDTRDLLAAGGTTSVADGVVDATDRQPIVSRSQSRIDRVSRVDRMLTDRATRRAVRAAETRKWTTAPLNLWTTPDDGARKVGVLAERKRVLVTGRAAGDRVEVVVDGDARWVTAGYLAARKPKTESRSESSEPGLGGACTNGTSVAGQPNIIAVHQAVCAAFPELTSYGTYRGDGEHAQGLAIDIMVSGSRGWEVAEFVRTHYAALGVSYIIYSQKIWSVDRASEGWRYMSDRGSVTANHYDHVHVTTY